VTVDDNEKKRLSYEDGDYVKFKEVLGMSEINESLPPVKIQVLTPYSFKMNLDTRSFSPYLR
jgi:hypothetical protein